MTQHVDEFTFQGGSLLIQSDALAFRQNQRSLYIQSACNFIGWSYKHMFVLQWCWLLFCAERIGWLALSTALFSTPSTLYAYSFKSISLRSGDFREGFRSRYKENCFQPYGEKYQGFEGEFRKYRTWVQCRKYV